jgi:hypothetical protein
MIPVRKLSSIISPILSTAANIKIIENVERMGIEDAENGSNQYDIHWNPHRTNLLIKDKEVPGTKSIVEDE